MSGWNDFRCAVQEAAESAICDREVVVQWFDDSRYSSIRKMLLTVVSAVPTYNREELVVESGVLEEQFSTMMTITVQFRSEDIEPIPAMDIAEKCRINLRRRVVREPLRENRVVFVGWPKVVGPLDYTSDGRVIHTFIFETTFNFVFTEDTAELETIDSAEVNGELETIDSVVIPVDTTITQP